MSTYEITLGEYDKYTDAYNLEKINPEILNNRRIIPITNVSWKEANKYAKWLSNTTNKKYSLPTESQWEYVAKAGSDSLFFWGNNTHEAFLYSAFNKEAIQKIGTKRPNNWGIYDMSGNVWEWCLDSYESTYANLPLNGESMSKLNDKKVIRGGAWNSKVWTLRTSNRLYIKSDKNRSTLGFRLVMEP